MFDSFISVSRRHNVNDMQSLAFCHFTSSDFNLAFTELTCLLRLAHVCAHWYLPHSGCPINPQVTPWNLYHALDQAETLHRTAQRCLPLAGSIWQFCLITADDDLLPQACFMFAGVPKFHPAFLHLTFSFAVILHFVISTNSPIVAFMYIMVLASLGYLRCF